MYVIQLAGYSTSNGIIPDDGRGVVVWEIHQRSSKKSVNYFLFLDVAGLN